MKIECHSKSYIFKPFLINQNRLSFFFLLCSFFSCRFHFFLFFFSKGIFFLLDKVSRFSELFWGLFFRFLLIFFFFTFLTIGYKLGWTFANFFSFFNRSGLFLLLVKVSLQIGMVVFWIFF